MWPNSSGSKLFGLGTDVDRSHVHEHSKVLPRSMFVHHSLHLREQLPQSFRGRPIIVRVGHPDVCGQIGHHTLSDAMEDALGSNLCTHRRGDQSDSDSLFRWSLKLGIFVRTFPPSAVTASWTPAKTCLGPVQAPIVEQKSNLHDEALGQHLLVKQSPHLGAASLCTSLFAQTDAD